MEWRSTEDNEVSGSGTNFPVHDPATPSLIAARLIERASAFNEAVFYVALDERAAEEISDSIRHLGQRISSVFFPPWDCLPFDRVPPSRYCMGRRMDALRVWTRSVAGARVFVTSLDAILQRVPPSKAVAACELEVKAGDSFDREAFGRFVRENGYLEDGLVDEPGEFALRDDLIDIYPAGARFPIRIELNDGGAIEELRSYDPQTQRTVRPFEAMSFGPASECMSIDIDHDAHVAKPMWRQLLAAYPDMSTLFDFMGEAHVVFADGTAARLEDYLSIIAEAREAYNVDQLDEKEQARSLYLTKDEFETCRGKVRDFRIDQRGRAVPNDAMGGRHSQDFIEQCVRSGKTVVVAGEGKFAEELCGKIGRKLDLEITRVEGWLDAKSGPGGSLRHLEANLGRGFEDDDGVTVVSIIESFGEQVTASDPKLLLAEPELTLGDVVVHEDHGVGVLRAIETVEVDGGRRDAARLEYRDGSSILVPLEEFAKLWRYGSEERVVSLDRLHTEAWAKKKAAVETDIENVARHLRKLASKRSKSKASRFIPPTAEFRKFAGRFPYRETPDQQAAIDAVLSDLASGTPMNRLICGDVGFGKTEVALRSAAAVALSGGQVVLVCPTTVLARQHFTTFERRFRSSGVTVAMLSRIADASETERVKAGIRSGEIGIVIATQAILGKNVAFAQLGLIIVDEEHRFGKRDKEAMGDLGEQVHRLTMTATPIPQTLQAAMIGLQDVSILATPPFRRRPVRTSLAEFDEASMRIGLSRERRRGGQSFVVVPQIEDIEPLREMLENIVPDLTVRVAHGKLPIAEMDAIMVRFADGDGDILLATNIIESGLDVPNANTIFVWRADRFGLAQLHQLRGRVGRGKAQGIAWLLTSAEGEAAEETKLRLSALVENDRLGAGLVLSMRDLELRGGGDLIGEDQAGHLKVLGIGLYQKLLERSLASPGSDSDKTQHLMSMNIGVVGSIPEEYVPDAAVRLNLNARLLRMWKPMDVDAFRDELEDRFSDLPDEVLTLLRVAKLKLMAAHVGICKLDGGPKGIAIEFAAKPTQKLVKVFSRKSQPIQREHRLVYERQFEDAGRRLSFLEDILADQPIASTRKDHAPCRVT